MRHRNITKNFRGLAINDNRNELIVYQVETNSYSIVSEHNINSADLINLTFEPYCLIVGELKTHHQIIVLIGGTKGQVYVHEPDKTRFYLLGGQALHKGPVNALEQIN